MSVGSRMKERRESLGMTQVQLAELLGVTKGAVGNYETDANSPKASILYKVFEALKCDANYLFQDEIRERREHAASPQEMERLVKKYRVLAPEWKEAVDDVLEIGYRVYEERQSALQAQRAKLQQSTEEISEEIMPEILFFVPEYQLPISAGPGEEAGLEAPEDLRLVRQPPRGTSYVARVHGDSMEPTYHDGDRVFVHATTEILPGQIGVFLMDGQQWIKELGDHKLISHNIEYAPIPMRDDIRCQGLVLGPCDSSYFRRR